ncbi:MAG: DNA-3-methyladenine glycosylase I [Gammaproteobacteria bacterium]|jgi:DNA-3-methyladenine glycosylase I
MIKRCEWSGNNPLYVKYHDKEWGVPVHNDKKLFEFIILEGAQAGLSWLTVLKKRAAYRKAFDKFNFEKIAKYKETKIKSLMSDAGIIRNRMKIDSAVRNANAFIQIREEFGTFNKYIWSFVNGKPIQNKWKSMRELPAKTELSDTISSDLKKRGFNFVGSTIVYAYMQATGMVNDHETCCFRYAEIKKISK